jgi:hypothetical protein
MCFVENEYAEMKHLIVLIIVVYLISSIFCCSILILTYNIVVNGCAAVCSIYQLVIAFSWYFWCYNLNIGAYGLCDHRLLVNNLIFCLNTWYNLDLIVIVLHFQKWTIVVNHYNLYCRLRLNLTVSWKLLFMKILKNFVWLTCSWKEFRFNKFIFWLPQ